LNVSRKFSGVEMKKIFILVFSIMSVCFAQNGYLTIEKNDGTSAQYTLLSIRCIEFPGTVTDIVSQKLVEKVIKSFQLYQNYPNPFNPSTTIEYEIPKTGLVEINIYNVQGRLVKKLDNSLHQSGTQKIVWNGRDNFGNTTASGIYFCQVKFAGDILVKKIVLIK
jgi:hypothetical protein